MRSVWILNFCGLVALLLAEARLTDENHWNEFKVSQVNHSVVQL
jgi:hypothetical protein